MNYKKKERKKKRKGELAWDTLIPWIIAVTILVLILVFAFLLRDKLGAMGTYIKNLFR